MEERKQNQSIFGEKINSLNNFWSDSGKNVIFTDVGNLYK